jgi:hypothetical protein
MDKIPNKTCSKCGAHWIEGQLYWQTGAKGKNEDLAGLVCNRLPDEDIPECINSKRGDITGQTWEYRRGFIDGVLEQATKR